MKKIDAELNKTKPIEAIWTSFKETTMGPDTPQDVIDDRRVIWFHSAWKVYTLMIDTAREGPKELEKIGDLICNEFREFADTRKRQKVIEGLRTSSKENF